MLYLNLGTAKGFLNISVTTYDAQLTLLMEGIEQAIDTYCGRPMGRATVTEYYSPVGGYDLILDRWPIATTADVSAVYEDYGGYWGQPSGTFDATTALVLGDDYAVRLDGVSKRAVLTRIGAQWPYSSQYTIGSLSGFRSPSFGTVKVTYTAGFSAGSPADVIAAAYSEVAALWASRRTGLGFQTSAGMDGYSISIQPFSGAQQAVAHSPFVTERLLKAVRPYRRLPVGAALGV